MSYEPNDHVFKLDVQQRMILSPAAKQDIRDILVWSMARFGPDGATRYRALLIQALRDVEANPLQPGSRTRTELAEGARTCHLALSRRHVEGRSVRRPRHFILYRVGLKGLEVARILHDSRDLALHLPDDYRS